MSRYKLTITVTAYVEAHDGEGEAKKAGGQIIDTIHAALAQRAPDNCDEWDADSLTIEEDRPRPRWLGATEGGGR